MATTDLQVGCHLPVYGPAATRDVLLGFARRMEALGYDSLWASNLDDLTAIYETFAKQVRPRV